MLELSIGARLEDNRSLDPKLRSRQVLFNQLCLVRVPQRNFSNNENAIPTLLSGLLCKRG